MKRTQQLNLFAPAVVEDDEDECDLFQPRDEPRPRPVRTPPAAPVASSKLTPAPKPAPKRAARRYAVPRGTSPHAAARRTAEAVVDAWHRNHGGSRMEIPVGVVAALSLWPLKGDDAHLQTDWILGLDTKDLLQLMRECWAYWWLRRPDLANRALPICTWMEEALSDHELSCVKAVAHAAITNSLLELTGSSMDPYDLAECDLMSWTITGLRSHGAREGLGEYHTPPEVCELMARMELGDCSQVGPGFSICDPAAGTGGMVRAAAQLMREHQVDPRTCRWHLADIDPIAAAGAATNMILWDLGPHTTVWCGDTLAQADTERRALEEKAAIFKHRDGVVRDMTMLAAIGGAERMVAGAVAAQAA
ncbi:N-6 DNA methylase [Kitasatospora purpeofusca]|uniref:N-6 DNA methylase n=1 Tax=Kitasatospora purpeofusca TaxID=67352 RepID=UPI002A59C562|nr:N-6 DNA methylase [Kitasatospora purpeofusca]MDY0811404.1 N-6 DNA methylase [Kitasatospora purpeofusca]